MFSFLKKAFKPKGKDSSNSPSQSIDNDLEDLEIERQDTASSMPSLTSQRHSKDFWMRDEQVKECYDCKQTFNYFRRKHHCRVCGQIFCHSCASNIVNGQGSPDLRVCDFCFHLMDGDQSGDNLGTGHRRESSSDGFRKLIESALSNPIVQNFSAPSFDTLSPLEIGNTVHQRRGSLASGYASLDRKDKDKDSEFPYFSSKSRGKKKQSVPFRPSLEDELEKTHHGYENDEYYDDRNSSFYNEENEGFQSGELISFLNVQPDSSPDSLFRDASLYKQSPFERRKQSSRKFSNRNYSRLGLSQHFKTSHPGSAQTSNSSLPSLQPPDLKQMQNVQLNQASVNHISQLMHQMLNRGSISQIEVWKTVMLEMLLSIVQKLDTNVRKGDEIDIRNYVKIKKIPGGIISESSYINGVVATKNVLHKQMLEPVENCKILLLTFPLEYQRVENQYMSLEPIVAQEKEHLKNLVGRVIALKPDVVMVEKTVARVALEFLLDANIIVVHSVKTNLLSAVSRCSKADIVHSIDKLSPQVMGYCERFSFKTFIHHLIPGYRKTFLFIEGCPEFLGCTLVLRGGTLAELTKVKEIMDFLVFAVYSLKLETCLLQDEYAMTPTIESVEFPPCASDENFADVQVSAIKLYETTILSGSPNVHFPIPFLLKHYADQSKGSSSQLLKPEKHEATTLAIESQIPLLLNAERLSPIAHQSIVVLYSNHSTSSILPCAVPQPHLIEYYGDSDLTLGQFIEDSCFGSDVICGAKDCEKSALMHYRTYSHGEGKVTVTVNSLPCPVNGLENQILMWSLCKICSFATPFIPMSEETWKYSFGKYLELTFYHTRLNCRANTCTHDIHRDFMRYFSFRNLAVRFEYEVIGLYEICGPPMRRKPKQETIIKLRQQDLETIKCQISDYYDSVIDRIQKFTYDIVAPEKQTPCQECMSGLSKKAISEKKFLLQLLHQTFIASSPSDCLAFNAIYKSLCENVASWEKEFASVIRNYLQTDVREIRRVTAVQIKRIFAEKEVPMPLDNRNTFFQGTDSQRVDLEQEMFIAIESSMLPCLDYDFDISASEKFTDTIQRQLSISLLQARTFRLPSLGSSPVWKPLSIDAPPVSILEDELVPLQAMTSSNFDNLSFLQQLLQGDTSEPKTPITVGEQLTGAANRPKTLRFDSSADSAMNSHPQTDRNFADEDLAEWNSITGVSGGAEKELTQFDPSTPEIRPTSLMKTITNLWNGNPGNFLPLDYPSNPGEHIFPDSPVIVREDEPSSLVSFALSSAHYISKLQTMRVGSEKGSEVQPVVITEDKDQNFTIEFDDNQADIEETLLRETGTHIRYQYWDGPTKMHCKIYFAEQFDALRRNCGISDIYEQSLARCIKWDATGGKSGTFFMKTRDDWLVVKKLSPIELEALVSFSPAYFEYMSHAFFHDLPTVLAKIFGFYQIGFKNPINKKTVKMDVLVMENLFYERPNVSRIFDLKGSVRNRHVQSTGKQNEVLLDKNLLEFILDSPLFIREHSKKVLRASVYNDTLFLSKLNVMDYSLLVGIDHESNELVIGIVGNLFFINQDFIRTFTWDKKLESWVKETGLLGGGKEPTIVTPRQYKTRFREAMEKYFLMVPDKFLISGSTAKEIGPDE